MLFAIGKGSIPQVTSFDKKHLCDQITNYDRKMVVSTYNKAMHRTLREHYSKTDHKVIDYYKGLLKHYSED